MLRSSLGFHTITLYMPLFNSKELVTDFLKYRKETGLIKMYSEKNNKSVTYNPPQGYISIPPTGISIYYSAGNYKGIKWNIRCSSVYGFEAFHIVEVTINPKILSGITDYITAATYSDLNVAIVKFNYESKKISPSLGTFEDYKITRIDYCVNIFLDELIPGCDSELIINLLKRGNIPNHFKEWMAYDEKAHRMKSKPESFYLVNKSVNINYYSKYMQLQNRSKQCVEDGHPPIPQETLDAARGIIRLEVQYKYHKIYALSKEAEKYGDNKYNKYKSILLPIVCVKIICEHYKKIIGSGDWYTFQEAVSIIESHHFNCQKEKRLIDALQYVSQCRSLAKAKASYQGDLDAFKQTLKDLSKLNINPVTIPREWGIKHIPNLLRTYFDKVLKEYFTPDVLGTNFDVYQGYSEYIKKFECSPI